MSTPTKANSGLLRNFWLKWKCENGQYWIDSFITRNYSLLECTGTVDWMNRPIINSSNLISPIHKLLHKASNSPKLNWLPETRAPCVTNESLNRSPTLSQLANFHSRERWKVRDQKIIYFDRNVLHKVHKQSPRRNHLPIIGTFNAPDVDTSDLRKRNFLTHFWALADDHPLIYYLAKLMC